MKRRRPVIIPAEIEVREFDAKLLLACMAAKRERTAFVGSRFAINMVAERFPAAVRLEKGLTLPSRKIFDRSKALGHLLLSWDEEGLVYFNRELYYERRLAPETVALVTTLLAVGDDNAEAWRTWPQYTNTPIEVTGNPRFDLLRPEFRAFYAGAAKALRDRHGDFVLINSNFGTVNFFHPHLSRFAGDREAKPDEGEGTLAGHRRALFRQFLEMVPAVARAFPQQRIVLRPHPAENPETWRRACAGLPNVTVSSEGAVQPWLLAAKLVIHNGCTTGVEAVLLDRPVVAYRPIQSAQWEIPLPNALAHSVFALDELKQVIRSVLAGESLPSGEAEKRKHLLEAHVAARTGSFACERILDAVDHAEAASVREPASLGERLFAIKSIVRRRRKKRERLSWKDSKVGQEFKTHSFPPLPLAEVRERAQRLRATNPIVPEVHIDELATNVFRVERADRRTRTGAWRWLWTSLLP